MELSEEIVGSFVRGLGNGEESAIAVLSLEPAVLAQLIDKASALIDLGKLGQAESLLIDLRDLAPRSGAIGYLLGDCRLERGDAVGAARAFGESLEHLADSVDGRLVQLAQLGRARALIQMGELRRARMDLEHVRNGLDGHLADLAQAALDALEADGADDEHPKTDPRS